MTDLVGKRYEEVNHRWKQVQNENNVGEVQVRFMIMIAQQIILFNGMNDLRHVFLHIFMTDDLPGAAFLIYYLFGIVQNVPGHICVKQHCICTSLWMGFHSK